MRPGPLLFGLALAAVAAAGAYTLSRRGGSRAHRPNVVLISIDSLRSDHLGCYGYRRDTSPVLDALANVDEWLDRRPDGPFFVFIHVWNVHFHYIPPPPFDTLFDPDYRGTVNGIYDFSVSGRPAHITDIAPTLLAPLNGPPLAALRSPGWKLVKNLDTGAREVFDLEHDPGKRDTPVIPEMTEAHLRSLGYLK